VDRIQESDTHDDSWQGDQQSSLVEVALSAKRTHKTASVYITGQVDITAGYGYHQIRINFTLV